MTIVSFDHLLGKSVVAQLDDGPMIAGELRQSVVPGLYEIADPDGVHYVVEAEHVKTITLATSERILEILERCTCRGSDDPDAWTKCEVHTLTEIWQLLTTPRYADAFAVGIYQLLPTEKTLFAEARTKLDRTSRKLLDLHEAIEAYRATNPYKLDIASDGSGVQVVFRVSEKPPDAISEKTAEAIQNLRTALEYVAVAVARKHAPNSGKRVKFPMLPSLAKLNSAKVQQGICDDGGQDWLDFINALKPCPDGNAKLFVLSQMNNVEKHAELVKVGAMPIGVHTSIPMGAPISVSGAGEFFEDGAVVARSHNLMSPEVRLETQLAFKGFDAFKYETLMDGLILLYHEVARTVLHAETAFG